MFTANIARFICVLIVLLAVSQLGTCIECYECSTIDNKDCITVNSKTPKVKCQETDVACHKAVTSILTYRACGLVDDVCLESAGCYSCNNTNFCNSSSNIVPSFIVTCIMGLVALKHFFS